MGEAVKGFVVIKEGVELKEADIISYARTQIAGINVQNLLTM
ncbi:MAG: hypothetical protein Ct9H300mP20_07780 [Gammaproteobacteria bacterium]|nr:MAG: hypothetical protein Ct9H300mP20_07780 [Gammaproteobacteria bacterium]